MKDFYFPNMPNTLTDFFLAVAEEVLVQGLVPVLVVELGGVRGHAGHVLDVTDCPPVELLGSHPGLPLTSHHHPHFSEAGAPKTHSQIH